MYLLARCLPALLPDPHSGLHIDKSPCAANSSRRTLTHNRHRMCQQIRGLAHARILPQRQENFPQFLFSQKVSTFQAPFSRSVNGTPIGLTSMSSALKSSATP